MLFDDVFRGIVREVRTGSFLVIVFAGACGTDEPPTMSIAERNPELRISHALLVGPTELGPGQLFVRVDLIDPDAGVFRANCIAEPASFGGTFRGTEMTVRSRGGEQIGDFECNHPNLIIDPFAETDPTNNTIEVYDESGSISMTFDGDVLEPRFATATSFDLHAGQPFAVTWSHPADLTNAAASLSFRETFPTIEGCPGCDPFEFVIDGSVTAPDQVTFTTPSFDFSHSGEILIRASFNPSTLAVPIECTAVACASVFAPQFLGTSNALP